jgi:propionyl-CoA carboxylase beta chain
MPDPSDPRRARLDALDAAAEQGGGPARIQKQHRDGKLTARERLDRLLDPASFVELDKFKTHRSHDFGMSEHQLPGDGVVTGYGLVAGRPVFVFAQDFTVFGGSLSGAVAEKICKVLDRAVEAGCPVVGLYDSGGARVQEGVQALAGYGDIFLRSALASGVIPQVSLILGPCAGGAAFSPALGDLVVMVKGISALFLGGTEAIREAGGEPVSVEALGGAVAHATRSGVAHLLHETEAEAIDAVRALLGYLPSSCRAPLPVQPAQDDPERREASLAAMVPEAPGQPYDVRDILRAVVDRGSLLELAEAFAGNVVVGLARLDGAPVGVVANQPSVLGGAIDRHAAVKAARFVRGCDAFGLPVVTFVDVPGFLPGVDQEWGGLALQGAKLVHAYAEATIPKLTVVTRKAYGGAYVVMASKHLRADVNLAWPGAEITVTNPEGAVGIIFRKELAAAKDPVAERARLAADYRDRYANPYEAARLGYIDEVIRPEDTRPRLIRALATLKDKRQERPARKHGNVPL